MQRKGKGKRGFV